MTAIEKKPNLGSGFDTLRLRANSAAATAAFGALGLALGDEADAEVVSFAALSTLTIGDVRYSSIADTSLSLPSVGDVAHYGIGDACYPRNSSTSVSCSDNSLPGGDAFDGFAGIALDGVGFQQPNDEVDLTTTADGVFIDTINPLAGVVSMSAWITFLTTQAPPCVPSSPWPIPATVP